MAGTLENTAKPSTLEAMKQWPEQTRTYIGELQQEMKRVTWPTREQVQGTTVVVILTVFAFSFYFFLVDQVIKNTVSRLYTVLTK